MSWTMIVGLDVALRLAPHFVRSITEQHLGRRVESRTVVRIVLGVF